MANLYDYQGNPIALTLDGLFDVSKYKEIYSGSSGQTQGSCIDDNGNIFTALYGSNKWRKYNVYTGSVTDYTYSANYGHMNDLAYCPVDGYIYCASMNSTGEVYIFNPSDDMSLVDTVYALDQNGNAYGISNLAFNRKTNQFISIDSANQILYYYDINFDYVSHVSMTDFYSSGTRQGMETDGTYIYHIVSPVNSTTVIVPYNMDGTRATDGTILIYPSATPEFEAMCYDWINKRYFMQSYNSGTMKIWWIGFKEYIGDGEVFGVFELIQE